MASPSGGRGARRRPHLDPLLGRAMLVMPEPSSGRASARQRFRAAVAAGPADGGRPEDEEILRTLGEAEITGVGEVPYGSNAVFLVELAADDPEVAGEPMRAVYKPARGERPLWDFPSHTLHLREEATYLADAALEFGRVPPTVLRDGPFGPGSLQLFLHPPEARPAAEQGELLEAQLHDVAVLDVLVNNADRKRAHLMVVRGPRVAAIDNALTFLPYPRQRTALISFGGSSIPEPAAQKLRALSNDAVKLNALRTRLSRLLAPHEVEAFMNRLRELAADPYYPVLDDWDGRPFEWW